MPQVLEFVRGLHLGTGLWGAKLSDGAIEQVDLIVEVDHLSKVSAVTQGGVLVTVWAHR